MNADLTTARNKTAGATGLMMTTVNLTEDSRIARVTTTVEEATAIDRKEVVAMATAHPTVTMIVEGMATTARSNRTTVRNAPVVMKDPQELIPQPLPATEWPATE